MLRARTSCLLLHPSWYSSSVLADLVSADQQKHTVLQQEELPLIVAQHRITGCDGMQAVGLCVAMAMAGDSVSSCHFNMSCRGLAEARRCAGHANIPALALERRSWQVSNKCMLRILW